MSSPDESFFVSVFELAKIPHIITFGLNHSFERHHPNKTVLNFKKKLETKVSRSSAHS